MLLRKLLGSISRYGVECAFVYNPRLSVQEFLAHVLNDFGLAAAGKTKGEMLSSFNNFLLERSRSGNNTALIIDEAHLLEWDLLEEIRLLTNLETSQHKLLQIVLAGQPELDDKVDSAALRQLKQRVGLRCKLKPLILEQLKPYIDCRLQLAGSTITSDRIFSEDAIETIYECSAGVPRIINNLCENCMLSSYAKQLALITVDVVREVALDLRLPLKAAASA
jgi:type II secretory pathway predicted ATPase ExeA